MKEHELLWAILPEGLEPYFEVEDFRKAKGSLSITLIEKNHVPADLPKEYRGKKVVNTLIKPITIDDFPVRGRKGELILKRRAWQFEGIAKLYKRNLKICAPGTKLEKEFADFLKDFHRQFPDSSEPGGIMEPFTSEKSRKTIQESSE